MATHPSGPPVKVRFEWDKKYYEEHIQESFLEPDVRLCVGELVIPPGVTLGSNVWDTFFSIYRALYLFDVERLGDKKDDLGISPRDDPEQTQELWYDERVWYVALYPTEDSEMLSIKYEFYEEDVRKYGAVNVPLKDFVRGILDSNVEYFNQIEEISALKEIESSISYAMESLNTSFQIIKEWYFARWEPDLSPDDPLFTYRFIPPE